MNMAKSILLLLVLLLYFIDFFLGNELSRVFLSILAFGLLIVTLPTAKLISKIMGLSLLSIGLFINFNLNKNSIIESIEGIQLNLPLLILILLSPLLSIPLKSGNYLDSSLAYIEKVKNEPKKLFLGISGFLALLTPILNVGSVRIMDDLIRNRNLHPQLLARAYFTGFSTAMVWSPYFGSVALVLYYLDISYSEYFLIGILFASLQLTVGNLLFGEKTKKIEFSSEEITKGDQAEINIFPLVFKFIVALSTLITLLIILESITEVSMLMLVSLLAVIVPAVWMLVSRKWVDFIRQIMIYKDRVNKGMSTEIVLFLSAGIFGSAISNSYISGWIKGILMGISSISFIYFAIFVIFIVMFCAFIGIHQIITVPILALQIEPDILGIHPVVIAFVFILAWFMSAIFSPFNAITILISNAVNKKALTIGFRWNGIYVLTMFVIGSVFMYILQMVYS